MQDKLRELGYELLYKGPIARILYDNDITDITKIPPDGFWAIEKIINK